ncbi:hypothetical protein KP509_08G066100 [Ceratopteris richardii]|uniref:Putative GTP diphosphokinase RSH1, chloroplastic n=1 Tax=Ceratopteris richardii TaxID=49495 RepID=A0A8T2UAR2_CERRI|nr:hypothetical protein KP509_08G066100 [Ceratopteris richardii]
MACSHFMADCTFFSCSSKAPRALSGWHASTSDSDYIWEKTQKSRSTGRTSLNQHTSVRGSGDVCSAFSFGIIKDKRHELRRCEIEVSCFESNDKIPEVSHALLEEILWEDLRPTISYLSVPQLKKVRSALKLAFKAHDGQKRKSGEPFITHPVEVARILGELELDWETLAAGLLHDTVEDTNVVTFSRIEEEFGPNVRRIVEGETKVSKLGKLQCAGSTAASRDVKADDLRQMFLAMTEEVRVIIVKLADRLHNMRTLMHMPPHKQGYIARETLQVFAPLAKLLGMYKIKSELEDLSFMYSQPDAHADLKKRVDELCNEHEEEALEAKRFLLERIADDQYLKFMGVDVKAHPLCKELYSIYKKLMECKGSIDEVRDIAQLRIILSPKEPSRLGPLGNPGQICYHVLGLTHQMWSPVPQSMKDYIATPKPNGYQSLHTKVLPFLYENTFRLEIQIRTEEMDVIAERGIAAHYSGRSSLLSSNEAGLPKESGSLMNNIDLARRVSWLNAIREWQEEFVGNMSAQEFVDTVTGDLLSSRVFVFTPKGEIKNLPRGATVIDYAYQIHTDLGNNMVAAKVNGNLVSPTHTLANAEVVEVITYKGLSVKSVFHRHRQWLRHAKTRSARHKITKFLREQATLVADEITADSVKDFLSESVEEETALLADFSSESVSEDEIDIKLEDSSLNNMNHQNSMSLPFRNLIIRASELNRNLFTQVNGTANKLMKEIYASSIASTKPMINGVSAPRLKPAADILFEQDIAASLEMWQAGKVSLWHGTESQSIKWISIFCLDRKGNVQSMSIFL